MKETFNQLIVFLKNPVDEPDENTAISYRLKKLFHLLIISILANIVVMIPLIFIEEMGWVNTENHAVDKMIEKHSMSMIFFFAVILAPLFEEFFFRGPLMFFGKKSFKIGFYVLAILFGYIHLFNFEIDNPILLFSPILVLPQILGGLSLGYIRTKFGLQWSIFLHAAFNFIMISIALLIEPV